MLDSASWSLLIAAVSEVFPAQFMCACRPVAVFTSDAMKTDFKKLCRAEQVTMIDLEPLELQYSLALVHNLLEVSSLPKEVSDIILNQGQGNPFFCEQIIRMLKDSGQIRVQHGKCRVIQGINESSNITVPDTVQGIITSRIDRLSQNEQVGGILLVKMGF
jgi:predicted ATPase